MAVEGGDYVADEVRGGLVPGCQEQQGHQDGLVRTQATLAAGACCQR